MIRYIETQIDNSALAKSSCALDQTIHPDVYFHMLQLTRGNSYIKLPDCFIYSLSICGCDPEKLLIKQTYQCALVVIIKGSLYNNMQHLLKIFRQKLA